MKKPTTKILSLLQTSIENRHRALGQGKEKEKVEHREILHHDRRVSRNPENLLLPYTIIHIVSRIPPCLHD